MEFRSLIERLQKLPSELIQQILIEVPLPQLLELCSHVTGIHAHCRDSGFWLARARARYDSSVDEFHRNEEYFEGMATAGLMAYLVTLHNLADMLIGNSLPQAQQELIDLIWNKLMTTARAHSHEPVQYYVIINDGVYLPVIFPAASYTEVILAVYEYLKSQGKIKTNYIDSYIQWSLRNMLETIDPDMVDGLEHIIPKLLGRFIDCFRDPKNLINIIPWQLQSRYLQQD
jgi:hypothetical protein